MRPAAAAVWTSCVIRAYIAGMGVRLDTVDDPGLEAGVTGEGGHPGPVAVVVEGLAVEDGAEADPGGQAVATDVGERGCCVGQQREPERRRVEVDGSFNIVDHVPDVEI